MSKVGGVYLSSHQQCIRVSIKKKKKSFYSFLRFVIIRFLTLAPLVGFMCYIITEWICISFITKVKLSNFSCLFTFCISSPCEISVWTVPALVVFFCLFYRINLNTTIFLSYRHCKYLLPVRNLFLPFLFGVS